MDKLQVAYQYALSFLGVPYKWGGENPISGIDCSGLVQEIAMCLGIDPVGDQTAQALFDYFETTGVVGKRGLGAFAFYGQSRNHITHVVFMLNDFQCIGANGGGSKVVDRASADNANAFVKIRPVNYRSDLIDTIMPNY